MVSLGYAPLTYLHLFPEHWPLTSLGALVLAQVIGISIGFFVGRDRKDPDPLLVMLPEGFAEFSNSRKPIVAIAFAELSELRLGQRTYKRTITRPNGGGSTTSTRTDTWLDLVYRDGRQDQWEPRITFVGPESAFQTITATYGPYVADSHQDD
jgi:hypothetical protein